MTTPQDKTSIKLKGAEFFDCPMEQIRLNLICEKFYFELYEISDGQGSVWLKTFKNFAHKEPYYKIYSLENDVITNDFIRTKTKLKSLPIIEFNDSHDLLATDYILIDTPEGNFLKPHDFRLNYAEQIDEYNKLLRQITNPTFGDLTENQNFISWSIFFSNRWGVLLNTLTQKDILKEEETICLNEFFDAIKGSLSEESLPVLINLQPDPTLFLSKQQQLTLYIDHVFCIWGTPEFEYAKREILKYPETPLFQSYKMELNQQIEMKARFFLYYVFFLLEEALLEHLNIKQSNNSVNPKNRAMTLAKNALQN